MNRRLSLDAHEQSWPLDEPFRIARSTRKEARVVVVTISDGQHSGRGEAVPLARYKQSAASVLAQIESMKSVPSWIDSRSNTCCRRGLHVMRWTARYGTLKRRL